MGAVAWSTLGGYNKCAYMEISSPGESFGDYRLGMSRSDVKRLLASNHVPITCEEDARIDVSNVFFAFSDKNEYGLVEIGIVKGRRDRFHSVGIGTTIHKMHCQLGPYVVRDVMAWTFCAIQRHTQGLFFKLKISTKELHMLKPL